MYHRQCLKYNLSLEGTIAPILPFDYIMRLTLLSIVFAALGLLQNVHASTSGSGSGDYSGGNSRLCYWVLDRY